MVPVKSQPLLVRGLTHAYGATPAVEDVSFDVPAGEIAVLLGPSGCGKSTVLKAIAGLIRPQRGALRLGPLDIGGIPSRARRIGMVFQNFALFPHMTVAENIGYALTCRRVPRAERRQRVADLMALVRLDGLAERLPHELSGGQQQRVAVARALAVDPPLLLLDEPFGALDRALRLDLQNELVRMRRSLAITTLMVTHDQDEAQNLAHQIILLNKGRVEQIGAPAEIYDHPASLFANEFIGESSRVKGIVATHGGGSSVVRLSTGECLEFKCSLDFAAGTRVVVTARPEHLLLSTEPSDGCLKARLEKTVALGPDLTHNLVLSDGTPLRAIERRSGGAPRYTASEAVFVSVRPDRCHVFASD